MSKKSYLKIRVDKQIFFKKRSLGKFVVDSETCSEIELISVIGFGEMDAPALKYYKSVDYRVYLSQFLFRRNTCT